MILPSAILTNSLALLSWDFVLGVTYSLTVVIECMKYGH